MKDCRLSNGLHVIHQPYEHLEDLDETGDFHANRHKGIATVMCPPHDQYASYARLA